MMLRRLKEDVEKNLAPKQETIIEVCVNLTHHLYTLTLQVAKCPGSILVSYEVCHPLIFRSVKMGV